MRLIRKSHKRCIAFALAFMMLFSCLFMTSWGDAGNVQASGLYTGTLYYSYAQQVASLVNSERQKQGLSSVSLDAELTELAMIRAAEIANTFAHSRPDGRSCFSILDDYAISWSAVAENIAYQSPSSTPSGIMKLWMNSSGHRSNILNSSYNAIGVGCFYYNGAYYWVQIFAKKTLKPYTTQSNITTQIYVSTNSAEKSYIASDPFPKATNPKSAADIGVKYSTHVQTYGWKQGYVSNGDISGTTGLGKRLEAIKIELTGTSGKNIGIRYQTHVQSIGWQGWRYDGAMSGTNNEAKRLEAIKIELTGADASKYDIYYRVHAQSYGWLGWAKNGEPSGTAGQGKRLEAIQIKVVPKGYSISDVAAYSFVDYGKKPSLTANTGVVRYQTHVQTYGWQNYVQDGSVSGTFNEAKRLEGIRINLNTSALGVSGGIRYRTHVQKDGWQDWRSNGAMSGTSGQAKRLEAIQIELTGDAAKKYDVYYRVHAQTFGWLGWAKNGAPAGTEGYAKRLEAIQIVVVPKGQSLSQFTSGGTAYHKYPN